jgi:membrane-bound lytic murein transglycosylase D
MSRRRIRNASWLLLALVTACQAPLRPVPAPAPDPKAVPVEVPAPTEVEPAAQPVVPQPGAEPIDAPARPLRGADLFARIVEGFADPPCVQDRVVQRWERTYGRWPPRLRSQLEAILPLLALVLEELQLHHLPTEFALLPIVESWYRPDAGTARTAYGMWQFTTSTAKHQGLRIVPGYDERLAPQRSTRAAMRYLAELQNRFGDWRLANMAYNAGEYRVMRALARVASAGGRPSAASHLPPGLSMTTYEHLAKIQALACLIAEPTRFGLELPLERVVEPLEVVAIPPGVDHLDQVARRHGVTLAEVRRLNPAFVGGTIVRAARHEVLLPASRAPINAETAVVPTAPPPRERSYEIRRGDTLGDIARRHGVALADLLRWNRLQLRSVIHPGQRLKLEP